MGWGRNAEDDLQGAPRLRLSVMCCVRHAVVQVLRKKLFELQMWSGIEGREDA